MHVMRACAQVSGCITLQQSVDVLLLQLPDSAAPSTRRTLHRAYWRLLHQCFLATDTDNTKVQVQSPLNRLWPARDTDEAAGADAGSLVMQRFLDMPAVSRKRSVRRAALCTTYIHG